MIYFVQSGKNGPVKIGKAKNVAKRVSSLATGHHEPLVVLATLDVADKYEAKLHGMLCGYRIRGEWFRWCSKVSVIVELAKAGRLPDFHTKFEAEIKLGPPAMNELDKLRMRLSGHPTPTAITKAARRRGHTVVIQTVINALDPNGSPNWRTIQALMDAADELESAERAA